MPRKSSADRRYGFTLALAVVLLWQPGLQAGEFPIADKVVIEKAARKLHLIQGSKLFRTFDIALGMRPIGSKQQEGDLKTPEGQYLLDVRNPNSDFFLSIHISYPNPVDVRSARSKGVAPGGAIMIHGQPNIPSRSEGYYRTQDWTEGCVAVSNSDMIDIWLMTENGTLVEILP